MPALRPYPWCALLLLFAFAPAEAGPTVTLRWTATGDDGATGRASRYEILVAPFVLNSANLQLATRLVPAPQPQVAGMLMTYQVQVPTGGVWYFAVRAADEAGNWSALSNVAAINVVTDGFTRAGLTLSLSAPFPQPARDRVQLTAILPESAPVEAIVYDIRGARVRTLHDGTLPAGQHELAWRVDDDRGRRLDAGIYFARVRIGPAVFTRRVVIAG